MSDPKSYVPDRWCGENMDFDEGDFGPSWKTCRNCGITKLHWQPMDDGRWRLFDESSCIHECKKVPLRS